MASYKYTNYQATELYTKTHTASLGSTHDIIPEGFAEATDARISYLTTPGFIGTIDPPNQTITWETLNDDLTVASSITFDNEDINGIGSSRTDQLNRAFRPISHNLSSLSFLSDIAAGVPSLWSVATGSTVWRNSYRPESAAHIGWPTTAGWVTGAGSVGWYYSSQWMRPGGIYFLVNQNNNGYQWELHRYPATMPQANFVDLDGGLNFGSDNPVNAAARISLEDTASATGVPRYLLYVNPEGTSAWTLSTPTAAVPRQLIRYDDSLTVMETIDLGTLLPGDPVTGAEMFAVQGDLLFLGDTGGNLRLYRLTDGALLASGTLTVDPGKTVQLQARIMPHPDGTMYVQYRTGIGSSSQGNNFSVMKYADAELVSSGYSSAFHDDFFTTYS